ncbi:MFS transporter [Patescibacteria group bacterium]|nr:MFS transporter [Patescibacteria group bacterium]
MLMLFTFALTDKLKNLFGHDPKWRTKPLPTTGHPPGAPFIIVNEVMERFSYYGMRAVLMIVITTLLPFDQIMTEEEANELFHGFIVWNYAFPILGAIIADAFLGKYRTVLYLSLVYAAGCFVLASDQSIGSIKLGLMLIAIGSGGIKPCVVAYLGDQYGEENKSLVNKTITRFYQGINLGALLSIFLTPLLLQWFGPEVAFGVPAVGMLLATFVFWTGRNKYAHSVPKGFSQVMTELRVGLKPLLKLVGLYLFMSAFFCIYDQSGGEWILQARKMDLNFLGFEWLAAQVQMLNPLIIVLFSGFLEDKLYPRIKKLLGSELSVITVGLGLTCLSFMMVTFVEIKLEDDILMSIGWQLGAYVLLTIGEVFAYLSAMQISYRKAMPSMKSFVQAVFLLSVALGNLFTQQVNGVIQQDPPTFAPDVIGEYVLSLTASDGQSESTSECTLVVMSDADYAVHDAKVKEGQKADQLDKSLKGTAGRDRAVKLGRTDVPLYGSAGSGKLGIKTFNYAWSIKSLPEGSKMTLTDMGGLDRRLASFTPDVFGLYTFGFEARLDAEKITDEVVVNVTDKNLPPVVLASASPVKFGDEDHPVILNGGATYDPNGDDLEYRWDIVKTPEGSAITSDDVKHRFVASKGSIIKGSERYLFFTILIILVTLGFIPFARKVDLGSDYYQGDKEEDSAGTA